MILKYFKQKPDVKSPVFSTPESACFDIHAYLKEDREQIVTYNKINQDGWTQIFSEQVTIAPGLRALIPTGLILDIPNGFSVRLHPRSGNSLKNGFTLANAEGVIDSDYVDPVYIILHNISDSIITIKNGDRICQAELVESLEYELFESGNAPEKKTIRDGGFGSTGN